MQKNILLFILFALPIRTFAFDLLVKKENSALLASTDSNKARTYPMLRFSYYLSWGMTNPAGSFGSLRKQNTTAYLQGYDGFGANRGIILLYTGFYFYLKKLPLPANQKIGINWTLLDVNFTTLGNTNDAVFASFSSNPGIIYSYCPGKHLALDAMANACFTRVSGFGNRSSSIVMQEIGLAMRLRFLYASISFKNGRVNGSFDGDTSPDADYTEQPLIVTPTTISEMSFRVNYFSLRLGVCF